MDLVRWRVVAVLLCCMWVGPKQSAQMVTTARTPIHQECLFSWMSLSTSSTCTAADGTHTQGAYISPNTTGTTQLWLTPPLPLPPEPNLPTLVSQQAVKCCSAARVTGPNAVAGTRRHGGALLVPILGPAGTGH